MFKLITNIFILIGASGWIYLIYGKISGGKAFERFCTFHLLEFDYFSIVLIFSTLFIVAPLIAIFLKLKEEKEFKQLKDEFEEKRNNKKKLE